MDRSSALHELPTAYAVALRLRDAGLEDDDIAHALDVPTESVPTLIEIGQCKLEAVIQRDNLAR